MMKTVVTLLMLFTLLSVNTFAEYEPYTQFSLPEGAKARLGKGEITGDITFLPDGTRLAVTSSIGIWLYDAQTDKELDILTGHTDWVKSVAFSPDGTTLNKTIRYCYANPVRTGIVASARDYPYWRCKFTME